MLDYDKKYLELTQGLFKCADPLPELYDRFSGFEKCVTVLRLNGLSYHDIQLKLGTPSKKDIRKALLNVDPELIDNSLSKIIKVNTEKRLIGVLLSRNQYTFELEEFGECVFEIDNNQVYFTDEFGNRNKFISWDDRTQKAILNEIIKILNLEFNI